ncbi:MAG: SAM-dependent methyltransferase [Ilumatobacteraceae bacterium]|nr:SAM-dependent methyltransferase [Ilumatobacteraceae bacterium]
MNDRAARAASFANTATAYERARPGYPQEVLDQVFAAIGLERPRILDLAAGTGKLTRQLTGYGTVTAVEPLAAMRRQLLDAVPGVECLDGTAEAIPLADGSVDVVTVGQAFHWFDQERANPEIARVLVDGGHLVAIWNIVDDTVPWLAEIQRIVRPHDLARPSRRAGGWWVPLFHNEPWFTVPQRFSGAMTVLTTRQLLVERIESQSAMSVLDEPERRPVLDQVAAVVAEFTDPFEEPYRTEAYWCRKLPLGES